MGIIMLKKCINYYDGSFFTPDNIYLFTHDPSDNIDWYATVNDLGDPHSISADFLENNFVDAANGD